MSVVVCLFHQWVSNLMSMMLRVLGYKFRDMISKSMNIGLYPLLFILFGFYYFCCTWVVLGV